MATWRREAHDLRSVLARDFEFDEEPDACNSDVYQDVSDDGAFRDALEKSEQKVALFDYQVDLADKVSQVVQSRSRGLLSLPTGAGKTRTVIVGVMDALKSGSVSRIAWLAPTRELIDQARSAFKSIWLSSGSAPNVVVTSEIDDDEAGALLWIGTPQKLLARGREGRSVPEFDCVVFDEAHMLGARKFRMGVLSVVDPGEAHESGGTSLVGASATPGRSDEREARDLVEMFSSRLLTSDRLGRNPVETLQRRGVLAELKFARLTKREVPLDDEAERTRITVRACKEISSRGQRAIVFANSVGGSVVLAEALRGMGIEAAAVHSAVSKGIRRQSVERFGNGQTEILTNHRLLATGYDCPAVSVVIIMGTVSSPILFEQIVGRAARGPLTGGARTASVLDFDDNLNLHGRPTSYYRYKDYDWSA